MDGRLLFEDLQVGQEWTSCSRTITETDVINFANSTGDHNPLHVDHELQNAKRTHYRQPVAHWDYLVLTFMGMAGLGSSAPDSVDTLAFTSIRNWEFRIHGLPPLFWRYRSCR